jgi:hypothetical protein
MTNISCKSVVEALAHPASIPQGKIKSIFDI